MKKQFVSLVIFLLSFSVGQAKDYILKSPDGKVEIKVVVDQNIRYQVTMDGREVLSPSAIDLTINGISLGVNPKIQRVKRSVIQENITMVVPRKFGALTNHCSQMTLWLKGSAALVFRAYNEGVAYRWKTSRKGQSQVDAEGVNFNFAGNYKIWFPEEESFYSHQEREYKYI